MRTTPQPSSPSSDKDTKLWAGQLYLSHTSEIVAKLLYKKFYRKTDCTILYGKWTTILRQQAAMLSDDSSLNDSVSGSISVSQSGSIKAHKRHASAEDNNWRAGRRFSDSTLLISDEFDQLPTILEDEEPAPKRDSFEAVTSPLPKRKTLFPQSPLVASQIGNGDTLKRMRSAKYRVSSPTMSRSSSYTPRAAGYETDSLIASSRGGIINPREIEPIQCFVLFYTSCWSIPHNEARKLKKIFGPNLVPKIERYIRDGLSGEQCPGTSILLETDCLPCKYIVCTSVARNQSLLSQDYAYNSFRSALQAIHSFNKKNLKDQITSILCPALECITSSPYNLIHQMVTCYEYWDWHIYAPGAVLPLGHADTDFINKEIQLTAPSIPKIAEDLEQYMWAGMLGARGLVYEVELNILLFWLDHSNKGISKKLPGVHKPTLPKYIIAQVLVDILKKPDTPPFTITPTQIYSGISGGALEYILELAIDGQVKIYDDILLKEKDLGETIAHGTSGKVVKAKWQDIDVAVKFFNSYQPQVFRNELTLITLARHPKLVQAFGGHCTERETYIVTELLDMNLYQFLQKRTLDYSSKIKIALDVAEAIEFLHSRGIVHRDLKSVNVLINLGHEITAKVCDFGLSRVVDDTNTMTGNVGTVAWIAPEIFQNKKYSDKCDVYSFGILLYELITQLLPFKELVSFKIPLVVMKGQRPVIPNDIVASTPKEYITLMKQCWHENGSKRPTFSQIITRLTAMQPEKISSSFLSTTEDDTTNTDMSVTTVSDEASSNATYSAMDLDTPIMEELRVSLKTRGHNKLVTEELLSKTLLAKKGKVPLAKKVIKSYLEWYQILNEGKPLKISDVRNTLEDRIIFVPQNATDKEGRSIVYWDAAKHNVDSISEPEFIKGLVYCLERVTERSDVHAKGIVIVGNFTGWTMANFSTRVMNSFFGTLRKHFPLILHKVFFVNPPPWISKVITMCQSFISSIMSQIEITSSAKLQDHISPENLFPCMNGSFSFDVDQWVRSRYEIEGVEYL